MSLSDSFLVANLKSERTERGQNWTLLLQHLPTVRKRKKEKTKGYVDWVKLRSLLYNTSQTDLFHPGCNQSIRLLRGARVWPGWEKNQCYWSNELWAGHGRKDLALRTFLMLLYVTYVQETDAIIMPPFNRWGNQGPERLTCPTHLARGR